MRKMLTPILVFFLLILSLPSMLSAAPPDNLALSWEASPERILVQFRPGASLPQVAEAHRQMGGKAKEVIPGVGVQVIEVPRGHAIARARAYSAHPLVTYAEPDRAARATGSPDDPWFANQWGMVRVQAPEAWEVTTGSAAINVAILDTGIDTAHPDLAARIVDSRNFTSSVTVEDVYGHGTHVAGIAAAITNNGIGVAGLGYSSSIMNVKVLGDDGIGLYSWIIQGIVWAVDNGAHVINMSLGGPIASSALEDAVNYAWDNGVVVVAAAGNYGGSEPFYPAYYVNSIAVAATDSYDNRAAWSNHGDWVDVAAPGVTIASTLDGGGYGYKSGTSMASPHVAGLAALVLSVVDDVNGDGRLNDEVRARIEANCDDIGVSGIGWGRINAYRAVTGENPPPPPPVGSITGTVRDSFDDLPIAGATVSCGSRVVVTDSGGEYIVEDLPEGEYAVLVAAAGYDSVSQTIAVPGGETSLADFALDSRPAKGGNISGAVTDAADGLPVAGAMVSCAGLWTVTDPGGSYTITGLLEGVLSVTVTATGYEDGWQSAEVSEGETSVADFALERLSPPTLLPMWTESISYTARGRHLHTTVSTVDEEGLLRGVTVLLTITNGDREWRFDGKTDHSGTVSFMIHRAGVGTYEALVTGLSAEGYEWDMDSGVISADYTISSSKPDKKK